jgi:hypothetical protein
MIKTKTLILQVELVVSLRGTAGDAANQFAHKVSFTEKIVFYHRGKNTHNLLIAEG